MTLTRYRTLLRRFAMALATAHLLVYAAAPVMEALTERTPGPAHVEAAKDHGCVPVHAASHCITCQLMTLHARLPESTRGPLFAEASRAVEQAARTVAPARAPPAGHHTRAPPIALG